MSVSWEELRRGMKDLLKEELKDFPQSQQPETPTESHSDHVCGCKNCFCDTIKKLDQTANFECADCHLPLPDVMVGDSSKGDPRGSIPCPLCGGKHAQNRTKSRITR
jgi:hypothetical protein